MNFILNVGSINLNSSTTTVNKFLLRDFINVNDIDILFLQEVRYANFSFVPSHRAVVTVDENGSGTAILVRASFDIAQPLLDIGNGITSIVVNNVNYVNVYAYSGTNRKKERDSLFLNDLTVHLNKPGASTNVVGGDLNCILNGFDCVGETKNYCTGLRQLVDMCGWKDVALSLRKNEFTFHRNNSASRIDRFYTHASFISNISDFRTVPVAFSDHCGILMKIRVNQTDIMPKGRGFWKINSSILNNENTSEQYSVACTEWKLRQTHNDDIDRWWKEIFKSKTKQFFKAKSWELNSKIREEKNYFNGKLYEWMHKKQRGEETWLDIKIIKSRIIEIEHDRLKHLSNCMNETSYLQGEIINVFQIASQIKYNDSSRFLKLKQDNTVIVDPMKLKNIAFEYFSLRFNDTDLNITSDASNDPINFITQKISTEDSQSLVEEISEEELKKVLADCAKKRTPGPDGLSYEFYSKNFNCVKDDMIRLFNSYLSGALKPHKGFSDGVIILIPKKGTRSTTLDDYRPISLLNCDYKLLMKIIATRIMKILDKLLGPGQTACLNNSSCINNLKDLRRILTRSCETKRFKGSILSIDLNKAFDRVDHNYLWRVLEKFNFPQQLIMCIKHIYEVASSRVQVNGFLTDEIKISTSVRQGCPLSMILFVLYVEPLIRQLSANLTGFWIYDKFIKVIVYADDFNIVVRNDNDFDLVLMIFENFSKYARIKINFSKSAFMRFNQARFGPQLVKEVDALKILGINFHRSWYKTIVKNYDTVINNIKLTLQKHSVRNLNLYERCWVVNTFILSKVWYVAQVFPPLNRHLAQLKSA